MMVQNPYKYWGKHILMLSATVEMMYERAMQAVDSWYQFQERRCFNSSKQPLDAQYARRLGWLFGTRFKIPCLFACKWTQLPDQYRYIGPVHAQSNLYESFNRMLISNRRQQALCISVVNILGMHNCANCALLNHPASAVANTDRRGLGCRTYTAGTETKKYRLASLTSWLSVRNWATYWHDDSWAYLWTLLGSFANIKRNML